MTQRAKEVLTQVEAVAGYTAYIELIRPLIKDKTVISTPMKKEVDRVTAAIDMALQGTSCAIVSSGDPGVYAMAGLVFEVCRTKNIALISSSDRRTRKSVEAGKHGLNIEVIPGIPALCAGASLLGAPLTHDFAAISLSDLLTPWEVIERRLDAAAMADFVIVLYNPKSKKRNWQLGRACEMILKYRNGKTPVGIVNRAMRDQQSAHITTLDELTSFPVDMQTTVFIGNSTTFAFMDFMVTPRGYAEKYKLA
ncbi:precorrin-3B C(17)-methyltransferase [Desulfococcaceae bacterium HSG9]|nr:precorrin-3B C(17)-methyltransferase [Desulfococcaceae bacterium HSG9]